MDVSEVTSGLLIILVTLDTVHNMPVRHRQKVMIFMVEKCCTKQFDKRLKVGTTAGLRW